MKLRKGNVVTHVCLFMVGGVVPFHIIPRTIPPVASPRDHTLWDFSPILPQEPQMRAVRILLDTFLLFCTLTVGVFVKSNKSRPMTR